MCKGVKYEQDKNLNGGNINSKIKKYKIVKHNNNNY